jgi:hypothetical protein
MGYCDGADVPVYDHLAEEFAVYDHWFARLSSDEVKKVRDRP